MENIHELNEQKDFSEDAAEQEHFQAVVASFFAYPIYSLREVDRVQANFGTLSASHKKLMKYDYMERVKNLKSAVMKNASFIYSVVSPHRDLFEWTKLKSGQEVFKEIPTSIKNRSKMRSTLRSIVRDWAKEGQRERDSCYKPLIDAIIQHYPKPITEEGDRVTVLVPGCGLGRLVFEFAQKGYAAQGNEFSYFMLLSSNFILNSTAHTEELELQPFIHSWSNVYDAKDPLQKFKIPDVWPGSLPQNSDFSMVAGEFIEVYGHHTDRWWSVATCFFLDTANNVMRYVETIWSILKPGGVWANFGPLLYHYAELEGECSIDLSWEELRHVITQMGFQITHEEFKDSLYASEPKSMMNVVYTCIFFTAVKPELTEKQGSTSTTPESKKTGETGSQEEEEDESKRVSQSASPNGKNQENDQKEEE